LTRNLSERLSYCRPRERGDPYTVPSRSAAAYGSRLCGGHRASKMRVAALAGTTQVFARIALLVLAALPARATEIPPADRRSDYEFLGPQTRAMQDDDTANPGMLGVLDGEALWNRRAGAANKSCADCHNDARLSMKGVAARYPAYSPALGRPIDLEARINQCRTEQQNATPLKFESKELLGLTAYLALQSRGMPIDVAADERTQPFIAAGREIFNRRQGQINMSCAQCHDDNWGQKLAGAPVPQGHPNGYPVYRLEWQSLGSLQRRLRNCMSGMRAEPYAFGAPENVDLELYLMSRARGLKMEAPAVRP
jgi:sulfur-oxidizing protein SoxA